MNPPESIASRVKALAAGAGFDLVRIGPATPLHAERARHLRWLEEGRQGDMRWMTAERAGRSADPAAVARGAQSVISVGLSYWAGPRPRSTGSGRIARYAWGRDYHSAMGDRLRALAESLADEFGGLHRWYVDTGPAMDKALAARSGIGWYGKNSNILTEQFGSFVLLGEIISTLRLPHDRPLARTCGTCRLCVKACPTGAIGPQYTVDSRRCISYLTIELRGPIPRDLRPLMGDWVFGCDICQDVCPPTMAAFLNDGTDRKRWTGQVRAALHGTEPGVEQVGRDIDLARHPLFAQGVRPSVDLLWLLRLSHEEYVEAFRGTAIKRAKCWMLRRNAAIALGNVGGLAAMDALGRSLCHDDSAVVRGHAAWALGRIDSRFGSRAGLRLLSQSRTRESEPSVLEEIDLAVADLNRAGAE